MAAATVAASLRELSNWQALLDACRKLEKEAETYKDRIKNCTDEEDPVFPPALRKDYESISFADDIATLQTVVDHFDDLRTIWLHERN